MIFNGWSSLYQTLVVGVLGYLAIIVLLQISGKRTLAKWNAFDFVVTIAFGSILAAMLLDNSTSLIQGLFGFGLLVTLQMAVSWLSVHSSKIQNLVKAEPALLLYQGEFQHSVLRRERVTQREVLASIRSSGIAAVEKVEAVVLETDGTFSVIPMSDRNSASALADVKGYPRDGGYSKH